MKITIITVAAALIALGGRTIVPQDQQRSEAAAKCEALGSTLGPNVTTSNGVGGAGQSFGCRNGVSVAVVNVTVGG